MPEFQYAPPRRNTESDEDTYIPSESFAQRTQEDEARPVPDEPDFNPFDDEDASDTLKKHRELFPQSAEEAAELLRRQEEETEEEDGDRLDTGAEESGEVSPARHCPEGNPSWIKRVAACLLGWWGKVRPAPGRGQPPKRSRPSDRRPAGRKKDFSKNRNFVRDHQDAPPGERGNQGGAGPNKRRRKRKGKNRQDQDNAPQNRPPNRVTEPKGQTPPPGGPPLPPPSQSAAQNSAATGGAPSSGQRRRNRNRNRNRRPPEGPGRDND